MAGHMEGSLKSCTNTHVHVYLFMCLWLMGQSREIRFSNQPLLFCVHFCSFKQSWYTGFVDHSECSSLQEVPDVRSSQHQYLYEK